MARRKKHPNKEIEEAIRFAVKRGWRYLESGKSAHAWGQLLCPLADRECCRMSIWSTPRDPDNHAKQIKRNVKSCPHLHEEDLK